MKYFLCLSMLICMQVSAQVKYKNILIDEDNSSIGPEEPSICISPKKPNIIVAGANIKRRYYSHDAGLTWTSKELESKYGVWGDPCVIADKKGRFYFFHLSDPTGLNWNSEELLDRIVCQRSNKKGTRWNKGTYMGFAHPKDQDKEWAVIDPENGNIYVSWTQFDVYGSKKKEDESVILFSRSTNKGKKWSEPLRINSFAGDCLDDDGTAEGAFPAVGPNGEVYVVWARENKLWFNYSTDEGKTFQEKEVEIADQHGGWNTDIPGVMRSNGLPVTLCDLSNGKHRGTIYVNWTDTRNGSDDTDVFVIKSTDNGKTWSKPIQINNDKTVSHQFFTWMTIDQVTGYLFTVFYDRRAYQNNKTDLYLAVSKDGGDTWINERINEFTFEPDKGTFFGDYINISAHNGMVRPIWTAEVNGKLQLWTAIIQID